MMPLTSNNTESSSPSPRTSVGLASDTFEPDKGVSMAGTPAMGSIIRFPTRLKIPTACRNVGR
jgi:hypothetical protein